MRKRWWVELLPSTVHLWQKSLEHTRSVPQIVLASKAIVKSPAPELFLQDLDHLFIPRRVRLPFLHIYPKKQLAGDDGLMLWMAPSSEQSYFNLLFLLTSFPWTSSTSFGILQTLEITYGVLVRYIPCFWHSSFRLQLSDIPSHRRDPGHCLGRTSFPKARSFSTRPTRKSSPREPARCC